MITYITYTTCTYIFDFSTTYVSRYLTSAYIASYKYVVLKSKNCNWLLIEGFCKSSQVIDLDIDHEIR